MRRPSRSTAGRRCIALLAVLSGVGAIGLMGCAHIGRLQYKPNTMSRTNSDSTAHSAGSSATRLSGSSPARAEEHMALGPMFGDTSIGLMPGTADTSKRFLGRLRQGYAADTLNVMLFGDNRPGWRSTRLAPQYFRIRGLLSSSPKRIAAGLFSIPVLLFRGLWPDLALIRDIPGRLRHMPTWGPETKVITAMLAKVDSIKASGGVVAAVVNTGDLVNDGRYPAHWERFLRITKPLYSKVPYFAVAGNHERTDTVEGVENWRTATGLPVASDRLYYCFDSADGWVRFIALDSGPMANPANLWSREAQVKYSDEEIKWMVARLKEHRGPAFVFMHHPPFSAGFHRTEWQADSVLRQRREVMISAMHEAGIAIMANGHEHAYERALFTWPDAVMIDLVTGGAGAPLYQLPSPALSAELFSQYHVAGAEVKPENVFTGSFNHFIHVRLWLGGGEIQTFAVDRNSRSTMVDQVHIDLKRYGIPKIDQHKIPIVPKTSPATNANEEIVGKPAPPAADSLAASKRILKRPPRVQKQAARDSVIKAKTPAARDSVLKSTRPAPRPTPKP